MNIKDKLINDYIQDKARELRKYLLNEIDNYLQKCHEVKIGKSDPFALGISVEEIDTIYDKVIGLRKLINVSVSDLYTLNIEAVINITPPKSNLRHNFKILFECE